LLLQYLQKTQAFVVLGVINEHITFEVSPGQSSLISDDADVVALIGTSKDLAKQINQKEVHWGLLEDSVEEQMEKALAESDKIEAESNDADAEDNKKRNTEGGKQNTSLVWGHLLSAAKEHCLHRGRLTVLLSSGMSLSAQKP